MAPNCHRNSYLWSVLPVFFACPLLSAPFCTLGLPPALGQHPVSHWCHWEEMINNKPISGQVKGPDCGRQIDAAGGCRLLFYSFVHYRTVEQELR